MTTADDPKPEPDHAAENRKRMGRLFDTTAPAPSRPPAPEPDKPAEPDA